MAGDPERCAGPFRDEHEREGVKRTRPFDQLGVLEAEGVLFRHKDVADGDIVATRTAEPGGVPGIQDFALRQSQKTLASFGHSTAAEARCAIRENSATQPRPFAVMAAADEREAPLTLYPPGTLCAVPVVVAAAPVATNTSAYILRATS